MTDAAKDRLAGVARWAVGEHIHANDRPQPVCTHQQRPFDGRRISLHPHAHPTLHVLDRGDLRARTNRGGIDLRHERRMKRSVTQHVAQSPGPLENPREAHFCQVGPSARAHNESLERRTTAEEFVSDVEGLQGANRARENPKGRTRVSDFRRALEHDEREGELRERARKRQPPDTTADDDGSVQLHERSPVLHRPDA